MWYQKVDKNEKGKDYIFPDIHGQYTQMMMLLDHVNFDPIVDRVFCSGDLVDRGEDSFDVLKLFDQQPNFYSVGGNHDYEVKEFIEYWMEHNDQEYVRNCFSKMAESWITTLTTDELLYVIRVNDAKPGIITVENDFNLVHSCIIDQKGKRVEEQSLIEKVDYTNSAIWWDRTYAKGAKLSKKQTNDNMLRTYCGHTVARRPRFDRGYVYMDCGSFVDDYGYGLCIADHSNNVIHKLKNVGGGITSYDIPN